MVCGDLQLNGCPSSPKSRGAGVRKDDINLEPAKIRERLGRLHQQIEAGSPRPQFELEFDPLGLIRGRAQAFRGKQRDRGRSATGFRRRTMRVLLVVTNQQIDRAFECQELMREVNAFRAEAAEGLGRRSASDLVTGRSAYVAEISLRCAMT